MRTLVLSLSACCAALASGCAVNPPLLFADQVTYGIGLGNDAASAGGAVSLGYKHRSLAVGPVWGLQERGRAFAVRAADGGGDDSSDALSVFAVFENSGTTPAGGPPRVRIGQIFSTGLAAQAVAQGIQCRHEGTAAGCGANETGFRKEARKDKGPETQSSSASTPRLGDDRPYQTPLVFSRNDVVGLDIGGAIAEQGMSFSLGWSTRNLALIPVVAPSAGQGVTSLFGAGEAGESDSYSVVGQFESNTETRGLGIGLERFFATGVAAVKLGQGIRSALVKPAEPPQQTAQPPAAPASAVASAGL